MSILRTVKRRNKAREPHQSCARLMEAKIRCTLRRPAAHKRQTGLSSHARRLWILRAATVVGIVAAGLLAWQVELAAKTPLRLYATTADHAQSQPTLEVRPTFLARLVSFFRHEQPNVTNVTLTDASGHAVQASFHATPANRGTASTIAFAAQPTLRPGRYSATVTTLQGTKTQTMKQDFTWGVLALNVPSATVQPWEDVPLHIAVLDDSGAMVCDAQVTLTVTDPRGKKVIYRTGDRRPPVRPIGVNPECTRKKRTDRPDYEAHYRPAKTGRYTLHLTAKTENGVRELADSFDVVAQRQFSIRREQSPTRLFPAAAYPVAFLVQPNADFHGVVEELVPASFGITDVSDGGGVLPADQERQTVRWTVNWRAGQQYRLGYTFDAPDTSPAFFTLGPLRIGGTTEERPWQIAVDGTEQFIAFTDGDVPSGWTCISCTSGDPFYQKFPRGNTTYGGTGGATTHTHGVVLVSTTNNGTSTLSSSTTGITYADPAEEHATISDTSASSETNLPVYRNLKVIRYNQTGNPSAIPTGVITLFDAAPSGSWTRYSNQDSNFLYGEADGTGTGGAASHTHTFSGTLGSSADPVGVTANSGTNASPAGANIAHGHSFSGTTAGEDHTPTHVKALLYQATATVATPSGIIGLWSAAPPSGWTSVSGAGGDFNQRFLQGASAYSVPAASGTHTPTNATVSSGTSANNTNRRAQSAATTISAATHTHSTTVSFASSDNLPPYFDAIIAKKDAATSVTISGTIYTDEGSTAYNCSTNNLTVAIRVNGTGTYSGTCSASNGTYSIGSVSISAGDIVTVFLDGETEKAATVTRSSNAAISGLDLYQNRLIVRDEDGSAIDNSLLGLYDADDDADIPFTSNSSALSVSSGTELHVWAGKTFTPGGSVTTAASSSPSAAAGDVHIAASSTLSMGTNALSVGGDYNNAGTFSKSTGQTTTFTATATGFSITPGTGNFDSLTFNGSGGGWSPAAALAVDVDLTMTAGTLSGTQNITVNGAVVGTAGSIVLTGGTFTQRVGAAKNFGTTSGSTAWSFSNLTLSNSAGTSSTVTTQSGGTGSITVAGTLTVGSGSDAAGTTLDLANRTWIFTGTSPISITSSPAATLTANLSTIRYTVTSALTVPLTISYSTLELKPASGSPTYTLGSGASQTLTVSSSLTIGDGTNAVTVRADTYNPATNVAGSVTINTNATYTKGTGTFTFNGTTAGTFTDSTSTPQNLGAVSINKTDTAAPSTNNKVTLASSMTADTLTIDGTSGSADTLNLGSSGYTLKLANAGSTATVLTVSGTLTAGTSTVTFSATNSDGNVNVPTLTYSSIRFSGAETYVLTGNLSSANAIGGNMTIDSGATLDVVADSDYAMSVAGNWSNSGTFRPRSGIVTFNGSSSQTVDNGSGAFSDLVIANTGTAGTANDDVIPSSDVTVNDDLTVTSGQFKLSTNDPDVSVAGNISIGSSGIITKGSGTWTFNGTTATTFTDSTTMPQNLGAVSINKTDTVAASTNNKVTLASSMTVDTITINGTSGSADTLNLGSSGYTLKLANAGSTANVLTVDGTLTAGTSTVDFAATNSSGSVTVPALTYSSLTLSGSETYNAAGSLTVSGDLTMSGGTFVAPSGTLTIGGSLNNDGAFTHNSGTAVFNGTSGTQHIDADGTGSEAFNNVTFSGSATWNMDSSVTVEGTFTQSAGTIYAPQTTLAVAGNFVHSGGTFVGNGGTVLLNGSDQTISGATTFAHLTKTVTAARTLTFPAGGTQTVTGTLTLQGASGALLSLRSSTSGTQWKVDPQGTRSIEYLDVQDSNNTNATKIETSGFHVTNSGNNTGWAFPPSAPTGFSGTAVSSTSILWTWTDASDNETGFKLEAADGTVLITVDSAGAQSVTETGLVHGTSYTRQVVAYNTDGVSETSWTDTVTTRASAPSIPELISPSENALLNTLTPAFSFHRSTDDDDGMGTYTLFLNPNADHAKTVFLGSVPASGSETQDLAAVTGTDDAGTAQLTDDTLLQEGSNTWQVRAMDTAENPSDSVVRTFVVDITKPTLTAFSLTPQAEGSAASLYLSTSQQPTLALTAKDNYQLKKTVTHFLRHRFFLGEEIGTTEELTRTALMSGTQKTVSITPISPLPYGVYTLRIETFDAAGNSSTTERSMTLQTAEKIVQRPTTPGSTPAEEREKEIERGETPTKIPEDLTLPNLERHAFERRGKEASNFTAFVLRFVPKGSLERFERTMNRAANGTRSFLSGLARSSGRRLAAFFGFSAKSLAQLRTVMQLPACGTDCASQEQLVRASPLGETLQNVLPKATGRAVVAWKTFQNRATRLLIAGRKNRSQVASNNEAIIARSLQPVTRAARWIGVGVRVALEGMRGKYEQRLQITNVAINAASPDSAAITWKTNRVSKGKLNYGQTISYGQEAFEQVFATDHKIELQGLQPGTKYYFEVLATDIDGGQTFDAYYGFTTPVQ